MRTIIDLRQEHVDKLSRYCAREGVSRAEAVRRAVAALPEESPSERRRVALDATRGVWRDRKLDALEFVRTLRADWD